MKLLYLVPRDLYRTKMSQVRWQQVARIFQHPQVRGHISGPGWPDWDASVPPVNAVGKLRVNGELPDAALVYKVPGLKGTSIPVITSYNEAYEYEKVNREVLNDLGASFVIFHHSADLPRYAHWQELGVTRVHLPHCAEPDIYRDYGEEKTVDILCIGNMNNAFYPFRYRLMQLALHVFARRSWKVKVLRHPGYTLPPREGTKVGEAFAREINRAKIVLTCSMRYKYQLAKYSEIALCRSLPVGDLPDECDECASRLERMVFQVEPWMTDAEIQRAVEDLLCDDDRLRQLTDKAREIALSELTMDRYADRFVAAVGPWLENLFEACRVRQEEEEAARHHVRPFLRSDAPTGTKVQFAYGDLATAEELRAIGLERIYTVWKIMPHRAPAVVILQEALDHTFPTTLFREVE